MKWKNIPPILLVLASWLIVLPFLCYTAGFRELSNRLFDSLVLPVCVAFPFILIGNVYCACFMAWDTKALARWNFRLKLLLIPVYLFVFVFAIGVPLVIPFLFLFDAVLLLTSSAYGLRALVRGKKERQIEGGAFVGLMLGHLCFVTDVIAAVKLHQRLKS